MSTALGQVAGFWDEWEVFNSMMELPEVRNRRWAATLIVAGLAAGLTMFVVVMCIVVFFTRNGKPFVENMPDVMGVHSFVLIAGILSVVGLSLSFVLPGMVSRSSVKALAATGPEMPTPKSLSQIWMVSTIAGAALVEGPGALCAIFFLLSADPIVLGFAGVCIVAMLSKLPTANKQRQWYDEHLEWYQQSQQNKIA